MADGEHRIFWAVSETLHRSSISSRRCCSETGHLLCLSVALFPIRLTKRRQADLGLPVITTNLEMTWRRECPVALRLLLAKALASADHLKVRRFLFLLSLFI